MGIKGIYKEIGAGARVAFLRLAVDSLEKRGRPLRLAIDISIWQFQVQAARGELQLLDLHFFYQQHDSDLVYWHQGAQIRLFALSFTAWCGCWACPFSPCSCLMA